MILVTKTVHAEPGGELDRLLDELDDAVERAIVLERKGARYRLVRLDGDEGYALADYDPEQAIAGMRAAAGSWSDIDAEAFKEYVYRAREEGSRPLDRS